MLVLKDIFKEYRSENSVVPALQGISLSFRKNEFVCILGQSGCGKTTLLNIIGGLDRYTTGDLVINGRSTKFFRDRDWDAYRNHSVGFVFQSYNLIPHQSVLANVELALTLSGVSRSERRKRAVEALKSVGLEDQIQKKPNQLSGGQMQRVAIARALVNNPDILLADEPTGALDSATSVQVMEILKEVAKQRLVIMVTHNPELAEKYATRIIRLLDGKVTSDSAPMTEEEAPAAASTQKKKQKAPKKKLPSMSFFTALSLSLNNLRTKKGRTLMTAFAGSIGIIGIALILSLSSGLQNYINKTEQSTLSSYPIMLEDTSVDMAGMMSSMMQMNTQTQTERDENRIYPNDVLTRMTDVMFADTKENDLKKFKEYIEQNQDLFDTYSSDIQYGYDTPLNIYKADTSDGAYQVNPSTVFEKLGLNTSMSTGENEAMDSVSGAMTSYQNTDVWTELIQNQAILENDYEVIAGRMPQQYNEVVVIVNQDNEISDYTLYSLGLLDPENLTQDTQNQSESQSTQPESYSYDDFLNLKFKLLLPPDFYEQQPDGTWVDKREDEMYLVNRINQAEELSVVGILRQTSDSGLDNQTGYIGYLPQLTTYVIEKVNNSPIVLQQMQNPETDVFTGLQFPDPDQPQTYTMQDVQDYMATQPETMQIQFQAWIDQMRAAGMSEEKIVELFAESVFEKVSESTYENNLKSLGVSDLDDPSSIRIYPIDFESKEELSALIDKYNEGKSEAEQITYTDYIGLMMSSITTIINSVSYVLIAFVAISLVVSSIMIGIITYISVLERTKEIGILRAVGASKRDVSRVFNAETLAVGFSAGLLGIIVTLLLNIPLNLVIESLSGISGVAALPWQGAVILIVISMLLTFIAGLIPSRVASNKDPVVALRTE